MLQKLYRTSLQSQLSPAQFLSLEIFVWLLQVHKQVKIERLAAHFPLPILFESRRRHLQRFLKLPVLSIPIIWFPIIEAIIKLKFNLGERLYLAIDRTHSSLDADGHIKFVQSKTLNLCQLPLVLLVLPIARLLLSIALSTSVLALCLILIFD